jgi:hypothetical protein
MKLIVNGEQKKWSKAFVVGTLAWIALLIVRLTTRSHTDYFLFWPVYLTAMGSTFGPPYYSIFKNRRMYRKARNNNVQENCREAG